MTKDQRFVVAGASAVVVAVLIGVLVVVLEPDGNGSPHARPPFQAPIIVARVPGAGVAIASDGAARPIVAAAWVRRVARTTGIPAPAVRAYAQATLLVGADRPGCRLSWTTLAGIGSIESRHGTFAGRTLRADGRSSRPVIGPPLNGKGGVRAIRPTAQSRQWHGDAKWEHAVGPMQFLAETWQQWKADGDADGTEDPFDLDDAAAASARYLCAGERDLGSVQGWNTGVYTYNHSASYLRSVAAAANRYARRAAA